MEKYRRYMLPIASIAFLISSHAATSGFWDDVKKGIKKSAECSVSPNYLSDPAMGLLSANSKVYSGPGTTCRGMGKASGSINVKVLGEKGDWYLVQVKDPKGKDVSGWAKKNRIALHTSSIRQQKEQQYTKGQNSKSVPKKSAKQTKIYPTEMVTEVQQLLNQRNYNAGVVDGIYGAGTKNAVMSFQRVSGLAVTGKLDVDTLVALKTGARMDVKANAVTVVETTSPSQITQSQPANESPTTIAQPIPGKTAIPEGASKEGSGNNPSKTVTHTPLEVTRPPMKETTPPEMTSKDISSSVKADADLDYILKIVSGPDSPSGVSRASKANPAQRDYFIIVEAKDLEGKLVNVNIVSAETGEARSVNTWGLQVDKAAFDKISADINDDGIIQNRFVGRKNAGEEKPNYFVNSIGGSILDWNSSAKWKSMQIDKKPTEVSNANNADLIMKRIGCGTKWIEVHIFVDEEVPISDHEVTKELLLRGAKYGSNNCLKSPTGFNRGFWVLLGYKANEKVHLTRKSNKTQAYAYYVIMDGKIKRDGTRSNDSREYVNRPAKEIQKRPVVEGNIVLKNVDCGNYDVTRVYVDERIDVNNDELIRSMLSRGAKHNAKVCKLRSNNNQVYLIPKTHIMDQDPEYWAYAKFSKIIDKPVKYHNKEGERRRKEAEKKARRDSLLAFLKSTKVEGVIDVKKLTANPFIYEGQIVLMKSSFSTMLSKHDALFYRINYFGNPQDIFLVTNVPTTRFNEEKKLLLVGKVTGSKRYRMPSGNEMLLTQIEFIDAYEDDYEYRDLAWSMAEVIERNVVERPNNTLLGEWYSVCNTHDGDFEFGKDGYFGGHGASWSVNNDQLSLKFRNDKEERYKITALDQNVLRIEMPGKICRAIRKEVINLQP